MVEGDWFMVIGAGSSFIQGVYFFLQGIGLIFKPGLRRYIVIPIIFNAILLILIFSTLALFLYHSLTPLTTDYPKWVIVIFGWLFWIFYSFITLLVSSFVFTVLTNIIASPFYGLLAEASAKLVGKEMQYQQYLRITDQSGITDQDQSSIKNQSSINFSSSNNSSASNKFSISNKPSLSSGGTEDANAGWLKTALVIAPRTLAREGRKLLHFLPWFLLCLLFIIFPFAWPFLPFVWWLVLTYFLAVQYIDYQPDNQQIHFKSVLAILKQNKLVVFGFGTVVSFAMLIPGANLFVPPAAVAGGTALWLSLQSKSEKR
jgi:CysZ protein